MRTFRSIVGCLAWAAVVLAAPTRVRAQGADVYAIAPGNEDVIARMLGSATRLPADCSLGSVRIEATHVVGAFSCGGSSPRVELRHALDPRATSRSIRTERFAVDFGAGMPAALSEDVIRRVRQHEADFHWTRVGAPTRSSIARERRGHTGPSNVRRAELWVAYVLTILSVPALLLAVRRVLRDFPRGSDGTGAWFRLAVVAGVLARLFAPLVLVTMYIGYLLTQQAIDLQLDSHYGLASQLPYHLLFSVLPHDHRSVMRFDAVLGMLSVPMVASLGARLAGDRRVGVIVAFLVALVPLFVKNDASEANNVPMLLALHAGLLLLHAHAESGERTELAAATVLLAFATVARPEMPVLAPVHVFAVLACVDAPVRARLVRSAGAWLAALSVALLAAPHAAHVLDAAADLRANDGLSGGRSGALLDAFFRGVVRLDTVLTPSLFPLAIPALAGIGVLRAERARRPARIALLAAAVIVLAVYGMDLCTANMARVHVPAALLVTILAAIGLVDELDRFESPSGRRAMLVLSLASIVATAIPSARQLWAPTNEGTEEELIRASIAALPRGSRFTLVRIDGVDAPAGSHDPTHRHFPDYLVRPPAGTGRTSSIRDFLDEPDFRAPAYFYWGMRCHARFRPEGSRPPHGDGVAAPCVELRERFRLEPVRVRRVPNHGDVWLEYYGDAPSFTLGLYRIWPRTPGSN